MGWLYMSYGHMGGHRSAKAYLDAQFTYDNERPDGTRHGLTVLASSCLRNRVYYAAAKPHGREAGDAVFAIVCLVRWNPRDSEGYIFGFKDMTEHTGPCEAECLARILDLLGPTDDENALAWRARCREALARRGRALTDGMRVRLVGPLTFTDGHVGHEFIVEKRGRGLAFRDPASRRLYRISRFRDRDWSIVPQTQVHRTTFARADGPHAPDRFP
jgi:hypothetical protein